MLWFFVSSVNFFLCTELTNTVTDYANLANWSIYFTFIFEKMFNIVNTLIENLKSWKCFLSSKTRGKLRLKYGLHFFLCRRRRFSCISISKKPSSSFFPFTSALISESDIMIFVISFPFCFFWRLAALIIFHHSSAFKGWSLKVIFFCLKQNCYFISTQAYFGLLWNLFAFLFEQTVQLK